MSRNWLEVLTCDNCPTRDCTRVFNRLFIVAMVGWALYCGVVFPSQKISNVLSRADDIYRLEENQCHEITMRGNAADMNACLKASEDAWEQRKQHPMRRVYAAYWPFILAATVGLPLVIYGTILGIAAVWFWMWRVGERR